MASRIQHPAHRPQVQHPAAPLHTSHPSQVGAVKSSYQLKAATQTSLRALDKSVPSKASSGLPTVRDLGRSIQQHRDVLAKTSRNIPNAYLASKIKEQPGYNVALPRRKNSPSGGDRRNRLGHPVIRNGNYVTRNGKKVMSPYFQFKPGTKVYDGVGKPLGELLPSLGGHAHQVKINYGQRKTMRDPDTGKEVNYVYAFGGSIDGGHKHYGVSGWVRESDFVGRNKKYITQMPTVTSKVPPHSSHSLTYKITGGNSRILKKYGDSKVVKGTTSKNMAASDYLKKEGTSVVNLLLNLPGKGGMSCDSIQIKQGQEVKFHSAGLKMRKVPLYQAPPHTDDRVYKNGKPQSMKFIYGHVDTPNGPRYGWIARDALLR